MNKEDIQLEVFVPDYLVEIVKRLVARDWFIHYFPATGKDLFHAPSYLWKQKVEGLDYVCVLDANILQFIINSVKKGSPNEQQRDAIGLVVFCIHAQITIEPSLACYERINHNALKSDEAIDEITLFRSIDSADPKDLASFALGFSDSISLYHSAQTDKEFLKKKLLEFRRLFEWDLMYLMVLKIVEIRYSQGSTGHEKLVKFVEWCLGEFRLSIVTMVFAVVAFGKRPSKKMIKYSPMLSEDKKRGALANMTWDMYNATKFFDLWIKKQNTEYIFASDDLAFKEVLRNAIDVQMADGAFEVLEEHISKATIEYLNKVETRRQSKTGRAYYSEKWHRNYRADLIAELEAKLF